MCKSKQENNCKVSDVSKKLMSKLDRCNFEGALTSDPKSVVSLVGCLDENGAADISVVSQKVVTDSHYKYASCDVIILPVQLQADFEQSVYRLHKNGDIEVPNNTFFDDLPKGLVLNISSAHSF